MKFSLRKIFRLRCERDESTDAQMLVGGWFIPPNDDRVRGEDEFARVSTIRFSKDADDRCRFRTRIFSTDECWCGILWSIQLMYLDLQWRLETNTYSMVCCCIAPGVVRMPSSLFFFDRLGQDYRETKKKDAREPYDTLRMETTCNMVVECSFFLSLWTRVCVLVGFFWTNTLTTKVLAVWTDVTGTSCGI